MLTGNVQNFAIIILINDRTQQVFLSKEQKQLFAKLCLTHVSENLPITLMPIDDIIQLQPDTEAFSGH